MSTENFNNLREGGQSAQRLIGSGSAHTHTHALVGGEEETSPTTPITNVIVDDDDDRPTTYALPLLTTVEGAVVVPKRHHVYVLQVLYAYNTAVYSSPVEVVLVSHIPLGPERMRAIVLKNKPGALREPVRVDIQRSAYLGYNAYVTRID